MTCNRRKKKKKYQRKEDKKNTSPAHTEVQQQYWGEGDIDLQLQKIDSIFINNKTRFDTVLNGPMDGIY